jgi:hypothetical protein
MLPLSPTWFGHGAWGAVEMKMGYATELVAREWMRERLREAERERLARLAAPQRQRDTARKRGLPWHARLTLAIGRRLGRVAEAS